MPLCRYPREVSRSSTVDTGGIYWASSGMPRYSRTIGYAVRSFPFSVSLSPFFSGLFVVFLDVAVALRAVILLDLCLQFSLGLPFLFLRGYCSLRRLHVAFVDGTWGRTYFVSFLGFPLFSSCGGFSVVHAFFGVFGFSADSRYCPRVASSSQLRKLDGNPLIWVVRGSPPVVSWHTLDRNLPIWVVRGSPPVVRWPTLDGNPAILRQGPALRAKARQEQTVPPPPRGIPSPWSCRSTLRSRLHLPGSQDGFPGAVKGLFEMDTEPGYPGVKEDLDATWSDELQANRHQPNLVAKRETR